MFISMKIVEANWARRELLTRWSDLFRVFIDGSLKSGKVLQSLSKPHKYLSLGFCNLNVKT